MCGFSSVFSGRCVLRRECVWSSRVCARERFVCGGRESALLRECVFGQKYVWVSGVLLGRECLFERYSMLSLRLCVLVWSVCLGGMSFGAGACVFRECVVAGVYLGRKCVFG